MLSSYGTTHPHPAGSFMMSDKQSDVWNLFSRSWVTLLAGLRTSAFLFSGQISCGNTNFLESIVLNSLIPKRRIQVSHKNGYRAVALKGLDTLLFCSIQRELSSHENCLTKFSSSVVGETFFSLFVSGESWLLFVTAQEPGGYSANSTTLLGYSRNCAFYNFWPSISDL